MFVRTFWFESYISIACVLKNFMHYYNTCNASYALSYFVEFVYMFKDCLSQKYVLQKFQYFLR